MNKTENGQVVIKISIMWFFVSIVIIALIISFFKNYIFATSKETEEVVVAFEENSQSVDVVQVMLTNTGSNKKMVNEQREVEFQTTYEDNPNLPLSEQQVKQEGKNGKIQVTALQEYDGDKMINEEIVEEKTIEEVVPQIIYIGTSEFMSKFSVHINDQMYLLDKEELKKEPVDTSETICQIPRYLNVTLIEAGEQWIKVIYNGQEGYLKTANITSNAVNPLIIEQNRIATLQNTLSLDMNVNKPSGLTLIDYKTILSNNLQDVNKIFEQQAETFYNAEQKYKINGVFIAAIGIHESGWGTSNLAINKKNLFGFGAYDRDPYNSATDFDSYAGSIDIVAKALATNYLNVIGTPITDDLVATGTYFNGNTIKSVNIKYASDENWGEKVFSCMQYLYNKL